MTVWYATPEVTRAQRDQARVLLGAWAASSRSTTRSFVAMATAVSGTGPTYVFLVMEALIDAAVHLGFPRHVAHDLVIETLEGSTLFAKSSGMHPAQLRNMVTSPGGTSAAALHELESGRLADRPLGGRLGRVPADGRARQEARGQRARPRSRWLRPGGKGNPATRLRRAASWRCSRIPMTRRSGRAASSHWPPPRSAGMADLCDERR